MLFGGSRNPRPCPVLTDGGDDRRSLGRSAHSATTLSGFCGVTCRSSGAAPTLREVVRRVQPYPGAVLGGPDILAYLVLALGAAMAVGSVLALVRPPDARQEGDLEQAPVPAAWCSRRSGSSPPSGRSAR